MVLGGKKYENEETNGSAACRYNDGGPDGWMRRV